VNSSASTGDGSSLRPPSYAFSVAPPKWRNKLESDIEMPQFLYSLATDSEMQFYLGAPGTGAPAHYHGHAVNTLVYGEKVYNTVCTNTSELQ
jgi:hypothetical protein